jgi:hypothetical protein
MSKQHTQHAKHTHGAHDVHRHRPKSQKPPLIPERYHDWLYCGGIALAVLVLLRATLFGAGVFDSSDNVASGSFVPYLETAKKSGEFPLWIPNIFSGMPSYAALLTTGERWWDVIMLVFNGVTVGFGKLLGSDAARVGSYYILYGVGMYLLMQSKIQERFIAFFTAFAAVFSTFIIVWVMIGHNTKPMALMTFPYILLCLEKLRERFSLLYVALLVIAVHILVESTHVQMAFYGVCCFGLYVLFELISRAISKESVTGVLRAAGILVLAGGLSFAMASDRYLSVMEYTPYSTRGTAPIEKTASGGNKQDASGGNDYDYATNWSFSPEEMITFFVPNYYGFGKLEYKGPITNNRATRVPSYWGQMPFTDAANYMGIGVLFMAIIGFVAFRRDMFVQFLFALALFALLLSFGKNMPLLYNAFFYGVPGFNKFRAPQMALALMQFAMPLLAGYGIAALLRFRNDEHHDKHSSERTKERTGGQHAASKWLLYGTVGAVAFLVSGFVYAAVGEQGYIQRAAASPTAQQLFADNKETAQEFYKFVFGEAMSDWYVTGLLGVLFMAFAWLYVRKTISQTLLFAVFGVLLVVDLWRVAVRPLEVSKETMQQTVFRKTDVVQFLQQDKSLFRIADFTGAPNVPAYFGLQHVHGYHSAKLRVYQDLLDVAGKGGGSVITNPFLWNLMNVKYLVYDRPLSESMQPVFKSQESPLMVFENPSVLPRAFFVNTVQVASPMEILKHLRDGDFSAIETAFVEQPLAERLDTVAGTLMTHLDNVKMLDYRNEYLKLEATATGTNFLVLSEVYYPAGWRAYIDGKETPIIKTNFAFRGVVVPQGKHIVEMRFTSDRFQTGKTLSLAGNVLTLLLLGVGVWQARPRKAATKE